MKYIFFLMISSFYFFYQQALGAELINVIVAHDVYRDYKIFINNRDPLKVTNFKGKGSRRDVVELVLLQQALNLPKYKYSVVFQEAPNYSRIIETIRQGKVAMGSNTVWKVDVDESYSYVSVPTIEDGEFEAGFYVSPYNIKALQTKNLNDIKKLIGISSESWTSDWEALSKLGLQGLYSTATWESMVKMVNAGRGDFLLAPFQPTKNMSLVVNEMEFVPIPNWKIKLSGSRVFTVSKKYKKSEQLIKDLNEGLIALKKRNIINKAYTESGFINAKVKNWNSVN